MFKLLPGLRLTAKELLCDVIIFFNDRLTALLKFAVKLYITFAYIIMKFFTRYYLCFLMLFCKASFAQSFITKVSATTIGKKDVLQIEYKADNVSIDQFTLPHFNKWTVLSGPNLSSSTVQTGNVIKQEMSYSVMVQPTATGILTVPGATALINNRPQRSNTVNVQVRNTDHLPGMQPQVQSPSTSLFDQMPFEDEVPSNQYLKKGEKAIDKIKNNILIKLEVNKHTCYVGEPILATYKLCTRLRSKSKVVKQPQFNGCTVVELTGEDQNQHVEKVNGTDYNVFVIRKVQLVPLEAGPLVLPQTSVENRVSFYDATNLSYHDLYYAPPTTPSEEQVVTLQNKTETVNVKPLPPMPSVGNSTFSGAVGSFDISAGTDEKILNANNTTHLLYTINGYGNLEDVKAPVVKWPKGFESFDAAEQVEEDKSGFPVKSKKTFSFPFIPAKKGNYTIPPVEFTYFDATINKYVTKITRPLILKVAEENKNFFNNIIRQNEADGFQNRLYILLGTAFAAVVIGLIWFNGKQKPAPKPAVIPVAIAEKETIQENKKPDTSGFLFAIRELQPENSGSQFYKQLYKILDSYLQSKFNIQISQLPLYIKQHQQHSLLFGELNNIAENCKLGIYTPVFSIEEAMQHRLQAIEVLTSLERENRL